MATNRQIIKEGNFEIHFPIETGAVLNELLEKYNLKEGVKKTIEKMEQAKSSQEKEKIFESLPGRIIVKTAKKVIEGKTDLKNLASELGKSLEIPLDQAKKLADEVAKKLIVLAEIIPIEKEEEEEEEEEEEILPSTKPEKPISEKKPKPKKSDVYRESIK